MSLKNNLACGAAIALALLATNPAFAQSTPAQVSAQMQALQQQIQQLQNQLQAVQTQINTQQTQVQQVQQRQSQAATAQKPSGLTWGNTGNIKLTLGGFIEAATIYRSRNELSDVGSSFSNIPFKDISTSHTSEFRETARQSRLSLQADGQFDKNTLVQAYFESDFLGSGTYSNSGESNSYVPRLRLAYATLDKTDWGYGFHVLAGQGWSLVTPTKEGITPHQEVIPLTIDAQYVPGFNWRRDPQIRVVQDINPMIHVGLSLESPQASFSGGAASGVVTSGAGLGGGGGTLNNVTDSANTPSYSLDVAPDAVLKLAVDPGFGHYELYGLGRAFQSRTITTTAVAPADNHLVIGGGIGGSAQVPVLPGTVDFIASGLGGKGIGTYGSAQLADVTTDSHGNVHALNEFSALTGLIGHVMPGFDTYLYAGIERVQSEQFAGGVGYGVGSANNSGCDQDLELAATASNSLCSAANKDVWQISPDLWNTLWQGPAGRVRIGLQYSFMRRDTFAGEGGGATGTTASLYGKGAAPYATDNIIMTSFRYYPF